MMLPETKTKSTRLILRPSTTTQTGKNSWIDKTPLSEILNKQNERGEDEGEMGIQILM